MNTYLYHVSVYLDKPTMNIHIYINNLVASCYVINSHVYKIIK